MDSHLRRIAAAFGARSLVEGKKLLPNRQLPVGIPPQTEIISRMDRTAT
jgi:hypothetical protein